jgi:hypothetical protein
MPRRPRTAPTRAPAKAPRAGYLSRRDARSRLPDAWWRKHEREPALEALAARFSGSKWSARLLRVLLEELHVDDEVSKIVGDLRRLRVSRSSQVVILALALRHSWRPDDFRRLLRRLGIAGPAPARRS